MGEPGGNQITTSTPDYILARWPCQSPGIKSVVATVTFSIRSITYQMTCSKEITVGGLGCNWLDEGTKPKTFSSASGIWKLQRKSWVEFTHFNVDAPGYRIGSWTRGYRENGNGRWKKKRTSLYTGVTGNTRDINTCVLDPAGDFQIEDCCKIRRKIRESKKISIPYKFDNGDVVAEHQLITENVSVEDVWLVCD